jgi:hypothetical protein
MPITFLCPKGHRLTCPDELGGKPGKCPKCGVVVRIPTATPPEAAPDGDADESRIESAGDNLTSDDLPPDQIIFLCPNGHRLHGPSSLSGRPGQCPHCGVKFLVPSPDEEEEEQSEEFVEQEPENLPLNDIVIQIDTSSKGGSSKSSKSGLTSSSSVSALANPTAALLSQLWRYKAQGASVEVHLGDGKLLEPDRFSTKDVNHAIFVAEEANGSFTLTAVAWTSIQRIVVRGLEELPKDWF